MQIENDKKLAIIGSGGHAKVLFEILRLTHPQSEVLFVVENKESITSPFPPKNVPAVNEQEFFNKVQTTDVLLLNGVGSIASTDKRKAVYQKYKSKDYQFLTVIHPSAVIAEGVEIGEGTQIFAGVVIQPGSCLEENVLLNTGSLIDHDCKIGAHVHVAPGAVLSGGVTVGTGTHLGTGSVIVQGCQIGRNCVIGAGSVVLKNVPDMATAWGVPAEIVRK